MSKYKGKFEEFELGVYHMVMEMACDIFKILLEEYDNEILENRDKGRYRNLGLRNQNLKTLFGVVQYKRHIYYDNQEKTYTFLLDKNLEIETFGTYSLNLVDRIKQLVTEVPYREVEAQLHNLTNVRLSHQSIWNLVQKIGGEILWEYEKKKEEEQCGMLKTEFLFEEHDGVYLRSQEKSNDRGIEIKAGTFYTGWEKTSDKGRYKLKNKIVFAAAIPAEEFIDMKETLAYFTYDMENVKYRIMNCDGAGWTFNNSDNTAVRQLDFFHIKQAIYMAISDKDEIKELYEMLIKKEYAKLLIRIKELENICVDERMKKRLTDLYRYLSNYRKELERYKDKIEYNTDKVLRNMGIQENQNYIIITRRMKHRRMSWTKNGATNLALVVCDEINNKTWDEIERNNKRTEIKEEVMLSATLRSAEKIRKKLAPDGKYGINDKILNNMITRLKNVSLI